MSDFEYEGSSSSTSAVFDPLYAAQKQLRECMNQQPAVISARSARVGNTATDVALNARRQSGGGANGSNNAGNASPAGASGVGSTPPEPQRNEPDDLITESEGTVNAGVDTGAAHNADATASLDEKAAFVEEPHHNKRSNESSDAQEQVERVYEPVPMVLRHRDGSEIPTMIEGDVCFTFDGDSTRPRDLPAIIVQAIRDELTRLGAPELGAASTPKTQSKTLSSGSLITALAMSALDIEIPGVDENTRRAAEVLRTGQGRVAAIEMKVEQVLDNQQRVQKDLDVMTKRALSAEKQLYELELMLTWLLVDKTEPRLFNQATATSIDLTHKTVVDARAKLRDKARELSKDESVQRGNLKIVE